MSVPDRNGNGIEDILDDWLAGRRGWEELRAEAMPPAALPTRSESAWRGPAAPPAGGPWARGNLRVLWWERSAAEMAAVGSAIKDGGGGCTVLHDLDRFGGVAVLEVDPQGLRGLLSARPSGRIMLDRDGTPALLESRKLVGVASLANTPWFLQGDFTATVAILDSGCDTAHDDLGDFSRDNVDGPPPKVGDALDWYDAAAGWPIFSGYKVVGWHDASDDFPAAVGPWDYHYHGTALAGVVAGEGEIDPSWHGLAPASRLTIVKFYDFDTVWHQWLGDFLDGCAWILDHRDTYRVRVLLVAVNWPVDGGIGTAMTEMVTAGILPIVAIGNDGQSGGELGYPARLPHVLSVGGVNDAGAVAAFSSRGNGALDKPDLVAPSGGLLATSGRITTTDNEPNDTYSDRYGTSLAAAHVAGGAILLLEALRKEGIPAPAQEEEQRLLGALFKATAAPVFYAETSDGAAVKNLAGGSGFDYVSGWGLLQVQAALEAALNPTTIGATVTDSLGARDGRLVMARRLALASRSSCRVRATCSAGLDVRLEIYNSNLLQDPQSGMGPYVSDQSGMGGTESGVYLSQPRGFAFAVVKRMAGFGRVTLTLSDLPDDIQTSYMANLNGSLVGWANKGDLAGTTGPSIILSASADIDPFARTIHALGPNGQERPGWPITLFLPSLLQGSLTAPLIWDLNGVPGDEIVVASAFGRVYILPGGGVVQERTVAGSDVPLTAPVGLQLADGQRRVMVADGAGTLHFLAGDATVIGSLPFGEQAPLQPAVGQLSGADGEEICIGFSKGSLFALDAGGQVLNGWPVQIGGALLRAPVLVDFDHDGLHEIVVPILPETPGPELVFRILHGDGQPAAGDGTAIAAPGGANWLAISEAAVGADDTGWRVWLYGLCSRDTPADSMTWSLAAVSLATDGLGTVSPLRGFSTQVLTPPGRLLMRWQRMPTPLVWDDRGVGATQPEFPVALGWEEDISGIPNLKGSFAAWLSLGTLEQPLTARGSLWLSGTAAETPGQMSALLYPVGEDAWARVSITGRKVIAQGIRRDLAKSPVWSSARADGRNSGAAPLMAGSPTGLMSPSADLIPSLNVWPNPGAGSVRISWRNLPAVSGRVTIYDLRGRRVRRLHVADLAATEWLPWDGLDERREPVAAGTYFCELSSKQGRWVGRVVMTR
jgi:hypothetical protein